MGRARPRGRVRPQPAEARAPDGAHPARPPRVPPGHRTQPAARGPRHAVRAPAGLRPHSRPRGMTGPATIAELPRPRRHPLLMAAEYWARPDTLFRHVDGLGDRFVVDIPGLPTWVCTTSPDDVKTIFT